MKTARLRVRLDFVVEHVVGGEKMLRAARAAAVSPTATHSANGIPGEQVTGDLTLMSADCGTCT
jgi:hypothetical protein